MESRARSRGAVCSARTRCLAAVAGTDVGRGAWGGGDGRSGGEAVPADSGWAICLSLWPESGRRLCASRGAGGYAGLWSVWVRLSHAGVCPVHRTGSVGHGAETASCITREERAWAPLAWVEVGKTEEQEGCLSLGSGEKQESGFIMR